MSEEQNGRKGNWFFRVTDYGGRKLTGQGVWFIALASLAAVFLLIIGIISISGFKKTPRDQIGISYGGGPVEGQHFQKIIEPGSGLFFNGLLDRLYLYPVTQRNYIIAQSAEGDVQGVISATSKDQIVVGFEVATYFRLNTDKLQKFHETIGLKHHAWTEEGWDAMLAQEFKPQIEFAVQKEARLYDAKAIFSDQATLVKIQGEIGARLKENIAEVLGDEYFCGVSFTSGNCTQFTFVLKNPTVPESLRTAYEANRSSEIAIQTKLNEVRQKEAEARAIDALNRALRSQQSSWAYVMLKAIESGKITFWVLPQDANVTVGGPQQ